MGQGRRRGMSALWSAGTLVAVLVLAGILGWYVAPYDPIQQDASARLAPPSGRHLMGTDEFGRDVFSRILASLQVSVLGAILPALAATAVAFGVARARTARPSRVWRFWQKAAAGAITAAFPIFAALMTFVAVELAGWRGLSPALAATAVGLAPWVIFQTFSLVEGSAAWASMLLMSWAWATTTLAVIGSLGLGVPPPYPDLGRMLSVALAGPPAPWLVWGPLQTLAIVLCIQLTGAYLLDRHSLIARPGRPAQPRATRVS
ncbi:MAG: hypothetical protein HY681_07745 [Chloroflexi bacterium]|nr:hypothetical protein [Chloroflexota bacterium]